jgi:integrase
MPQDRKPIKGQPGFYRRPGSQTVYFRVGKGNRRQWRTAPNLSAAKTRRQHLQTDFDRGELSPDGSAFVVDYGRRWIKSYVGRTSRGFQEETRKDYEARLERDCFVFFQRTRMWDVTPTLVREFYAWVSKRGAICRSCRNTPGKRERCRNCDGTGRKGDVGLGTVRLAAAPFKAMMATAYEDGVLSRNPTAGVRIPIPEQSEEQLLAEEDDEDEGPVKALSHDQLQRVLALVRSRYSYWLLFICLLVELGLRIGEGLELRWRDIDFDPDGYDGAIVYVRRRWYRGRVGRPKSRYGRRRLKLPPEVAALLRAHHVRELAEGRGGRDDLVFTTSTEHVRVDQGNLARDMLHPVRDELGLPWLTWHTFRHTAITHRFLAGWNPKQVQVFAGHHDAAFTVSTYVHLLSDELPDPEPLTEPAPLEVVV